MKQAGEELAEKLGGETSEDEIKRVIDSHNAKLKDMEERFDNQKDRQQAELMEKLAQRRLKREMALRDEHSKIVRNSLHSIFTKRYHVRLIGRKTDSVLMSIYSRILNLQSCWSCQGFKFLVFFYVRGYVKALDTFSLIAREASLRINPIHFD